MVRNIPAMNYWVLLVAGAALVLWMASRVVRLAITARATAWVPLATRWLAPWMGPRSYTAEELLSADDAGPEWVERRRAGLDRLARTLQSQYAESTAWSETLSDRFSDLRFTDVSRVPFPFMRAMRERFNLCSVVTASSGPYLRHLDGHWTLDVSGSYGLNVAGFDRYKEWMSKGWEQVKALGPVLGPLHPIVPENVEMLARFSGMDEVSFHMSGTEAVMAAVRVARFNTRRRLIVCFSGAYHGWWDGVQPGIGNERPLEDCLTLTDCHVASLRVIRHRAKEIAAVLVNPVQAFHPNSPPPNDAVLLTSDVRQTQASTERYAEWLKQLADTCRESGVPLIFDEVYTGFRLAPGGAQEYFGVRADMVVYGKTVAGGMPIGVVCGRRSLMQRFDPAHPMRLAYVVGTFSAHPLVMGAMNEFLKWAKTPDAAVAYREANDRCARWTQSTNERLVRAGLPIRVVNLATVWTVLFKESSRYNWLLQYYLRAEGVTLSWVGTGRCLSSMDFTDADYTILQQRILSAARAMMSDGWWLTNVEHPQKEKHMRARLTRDVLASLFPVPASLRAFYATVMQRKEDDHHASHSNTANQALHLVSSSVFIYCYLIAAASLTQAMFLGLAALFLRQFGHAVLEPACHDKEALLLGYNTRNKTLIVLGYALIPIVILARAHAWALGAALMQADTIAGLWLAWTMFVVFGRVAYLTLTHGFGNAMIWFVKLVTDPFTDVVAYFPFRAART